MIASRTMIRRTLRSAASLRVFGPSARLVTPSVRVFSATSLRCGRGGVDKELSAKLKSEYTLEMADGDPRIPSEAIQEFLKNGPFQVTDVEGNDEVILERQFGNETIRITFAVSNMNAGEEVDSDVFDEDGNPVEVEEDAEGGENGEEPSYPIPCQITIQKDGTESVMALDATTQDGLFVVERLSLYPSVELATGNSAEYSWKRSERFLGPEFSSLDEDLQSLMDRFLEERGINTSLALFVPDYVEYKEQREYVTWLQGVKKFIDV